MAKLVVIEGKLAGREYVIQKPVVIGRGEGLSIRPPDAKLSREHSKVYRQGDDYIVVDLNSRNGTFVNDAPVTKRVLHDGDEIRVGATRLRFLNPEAVSATPEPRVSAPAYRQVEDLNMSSQPVSTQAPAGAVSADDIVIRDQALQFSKKKGRKKAR